MRLRFVQHHEGSGTDDFDPTLCGRCRHPHRSLAGLSQADLLAFSVPGTWSIQQIILHLMDSDLIGSDRMKRVAAEEHPTLVGYDETAFSKRLGYEHLSAEMAAEIFRLDGLMTADVLRHLPDSAFGRTGRGTEAR